MAFIVRSKFSLASGPSLYSALRFISFNYAPFQFAPNNSILLASNSSYRHKFYRPGDMEASQGKSRRYPRNKKRTKKRIHRMREWSAAQPWLAPLIVIAFNLALLAVNLRGSGSVSLESGHLRNMYRPIRNLVGSGNFLCRTRVPAATRLAE